MQMAITLADMSAATSNGDPSLSVRPPTSPTAGWTEAAPEPIPFDLETRLNYFGLVRGRAGIGLGRFLVYGTAGLAYGDLEIESRADRLNLLRKRLTGIAAGGGVEICVERLDVAQSRISDNRFRRGRRFPRSPLAAMRLMPRWNFGKSGSCAGSKCDNARTAPWA